MTFTDGGGVEKNKPVASAFTLIQRKVIDMILR